MLFILYMMTVTVHIDLKVCIYIVSRNSIIEIHILSIMQRSEEVALHTFFNQYFLILYRLSTYSNSTPVEY